MKRYSFTILIFQIVPYFPQFLSTSLLRTRLHPTLLRSLTPPTKEAGSRSRQSLPSSHPPNYLSQQPLRPPLKTSPRRSLTVLPSAKSPLLMFPLFPEFQVSPTLASITRWAPSPPREEPLPAHTSRFWPAPPLSPSSARAWPLFPGFSCSVPFAPFHFSAFRPKATHFPLHKGGGPPYPRGPSGAPLLLRTSSLARALPGQSTRGRARGAAAQRIAPSVKSTSCRAREGALGTGMRRGWGVMVCGVRADATCSGDSG